MLVREQFAIGHDPLSCYRERLGVASYAITDRTRNSTLVLSRTGSVASMAANCSGVNA
jgi:hypothetical protein